MNDSQLILIGTVLLIVLLVSLLIHAHLDRKGLRSENSTLQERNANLRIEIRSLINQRHTLREQYAQRTKSENNCLLTCGVLRKKVDDLKEELEESENQRQILEIRLGQLQRSIN